MSTPTATYLGIGILALGAAAYYQKRGRAIPGIAFPTTFKGINATLIESQPLTHNSKLLRFGFPDSIKESGLSPLSVVVAKMEVPDSRKPQRRKYSSIYNTSNELELAIKLENPNGVSGALLNLNPGDTVNFRSHKGHRVDLDGLQSVNMVAGGSGIAPFYSISKYLMTEKKEAKVNLLFANKTPEDIMLKKELDQLKKDYPDRMNITYFVSKNESKASDVIEGHIDEPVLKEKLWKDADVYVCGPKSMERNLGGMSSPIRSIVDGKVVRF